MTRRMTPEDRRALSDLKHLFWTDWDPIGGVPKDEYDQYAMQAFGMRKRGEGAQAVAEYLKHIEDGWITLQTSEEVRQAVAAKAAGIVAPSAP